MGHSVDIFDVPEYPGKSDRRLNDPTYFAFTESKELLYTHEGQAETIIFYRLADERGWVHDFDPCNLGEKTIRLAATMVDPVSIFPLCSL